MVLISEFISHDPFRSSNPTVRSLGYCYAPATAWHLFVGAEPQFVGWLEQAELADYFTDLAVHTRLSRDFQSLSLLDVIAWRSIL